MKFSNFLNCQIGFNRYLIVTVQARYSCAILYYFFVVVVVKTLFYIIFKLQLKITKSTVSYLRFLVL